MNSSPSHIVTAVEAARRIYNTPSPTSEQVGRVVEKIHSGTLKRSPKGGPTTTVESIAEYMARREAGRGASGVRKATQTRGRLNGFYNELLSDYFFAILMRRRASHRTVAFHRSVMATQAALLVSLIVLMGTVSARTVRSLVLPSDHRAARAWLEEHYPNSEVREIKSLSNPPSSVLVKFRYQVNDRQIHSELTLTLSGSRVTGVNSGD